MASNHFSYLLEKQAHVPVERLNSLAKIAAKRFLEEKTPLTETIQKLASEHDLNSNQIERVCEMANLSTHQALWPKAAEKEKIAFELADAKKVKPGSAAKEKAECSPMNGDFAGPPTGTGDSGPSLLSMLGVNPADVHNGMHGPSEKQRIIIIMQKKAAERKSVRDRLLVAGMECETAEKLAFNAVKQTVLGGHTIRQVLSAAKSAGLGKVACQLLPKFQDQLIRDTHGSIRVGLEKNAISKAPEDLISDDLGSVTIVNGAHPVLISLDTVQKKNDVVKNLIGNLLRIEDEVKVYSQKLTELT